MEQTCQLFGNTCLGLILEIILQLVLVFVGVVVALWYDSFGDEKLTMQKYPTTHKDFQDKRGIGRFPHVGVKNAMPSKLPLIGRRTAINTHGTITFTTLDDEPIHSRPMPIRWSAQPQPLKYELTSTDTPIELPDLSLVPIGQLMNISSGAEKVIDIAWRKSTSDIAYGWSHENILRGWEHPDFVIPQGEFKVKIELQTGDKVFRETFRLVNPKDFEGFDLFSLY